MAQDGISINLTASGNISPFRAVRVSGTMTGSQAGSASARIVGIADGSTLSYASSYNAVAGTPINLGAKFWFQWEAGDAYIAGDALTCDSSGRSILADGGQEQVYAVACQTAGAAGDIIWCYWCPGIVAGIVNDSTVVEGTGTVADPLTDPA